MSPIMKAGSTWTGDAPTRNSGSPDSTNWPAPRSIQFSPVPITDSGPAARPKGMATTDTNAAGMTIIPHIGMAIRLPVSPNFAI